MADFKMIEMSTKLDRGKGAKYPKMIHAGMIGTTELARQISERSSSSTSDVLGVLRALGDVMAQEMAQGYSVKLEGLGVFAPTLGMKRGAETELADSTTKRNAQSVEVSNIKYRADKELVDRTRMHADLHRITIPKQVVPDRTEEERLNMALRYIKHSVPLRAKDYAQLTGLNRVKAGQELRLFAERGQLKMVGRHPHIYYINPDTEE